MAAHAFMLNLEHQLAQQRPHLLLQALNGRKHLRQAVEPCSPQGCCLLCKLLDSQCCFLPPC